MDPNTFPTKGNLILAKNSLELSKQGYDLMDKKRNILIRELMDLIAEATDIQNEIDTTFTNAYKALQKANVQMGIHNVEEMAEGIPVEDSVKLKRRSVMGTEIPKVEYDRKDRKPPYSFFGTKMSLDEACQQFEKVKELTLKLAEIENSAYRLAYNIKKTQKRANALSNITIPRYEHLVKEITEYLEEKEREEFTRLKVIKRMQTS
jgi:V/A-type H+-transporting ATPase subunit D